MKAEKFEIAIPDARIDDMRRLLRTTADGAFTLDLNYFDFLGKVETGFSQNFVDLFGPPRRSCRTIGCWHPTAR